MNWHLIFRLSLLSIVMGFASVLGLTRSYEWLVWLCVGLMCAWQFAKKTREELFLHGFYVGIFIGLIATAVVAHAVAMLFKGKGKFDESLKAVIYGASPFYAFGWLPIFGVLFGLYAVIVQVPAFKLLHRVRFHKAVCIVLGTLFLIGLLVGVLPFLGGLLGTGYHFGIVVNSVRGIVGLILA